jgi:hypothetical protein
MTGFQLHKDEANLTLLAEEEMRQKTAKRRMDIKSPLPMTNAKIKLDFSLSRSVSKDHTNSNTT